MNLLNSRQIILIPALLFIFIFFYTPLFGLAFESVRPSDDAVLMGSYINILSSSGYRSSIFNTFKLTVYITSLTLIIGYLFSLYIHFFIKSKIIKRSIYIILILPLFTTEIVRAFGWMIILGRKGILNETLIYLGLIDRPLNIMYSQLSVVIGLVYILIPFLTLIMLTVLQGLDKNLLDASKDLGATASVRFRTILLPLTQAGILTGSVIVFCLSVSAYVTPAILSGGKFSVISMLIYDSFAVSFNQNVGAALSIILLLFSMVIVYLYTLAIKSIIALGR